MQSYSHLTAPRVNLTEAKEYLTAAKEHLAAARGGGWCQGKKWKLRQKGKGEMKKKGKRGKEKEEKEKREDDFFVWIWLGEKITWWITISSLINFPHPLIFFPQQSFTSFPTIMKLSRSKNLRFCSSFWYFLFLKYLATPLDWNPLNSPAVLSLKTL